MSRCRLLAVAVAAGWIAGPRPARAVDPFEIQVYDGTADAPGTPGLELHANTVAAGPATPAAGARDPGGESHLTLEPSFGVLSVWELGAYLQTAVRADGRYEYAGAKLRSKLVTPPGWRPHLRLGVNVEVALLPETYDPERAGGEVRPIVAWEDPRWLLAANPILDFGFTAAAWHGGPGFEPAVALKRKLALHGGALGLALGLEYYAGFGPLWAPLAWRQQDQRLFQTADLAWGPFDLNLGVGEGLTPATEALVIKMIAGYSFGAAGHGP
jgi:hypothetical protein